MNAFAGFEFAGPNGRSLEIRSATPDDAQAVLDYMHAALPGLQAFVPITPAEFNFTVEQERELIAVVDPDRGELWLLVWDGDRVVGAAACRTVKLVRRAHVGNVEISLHHDYRGVGLGRALMEALVEWGERSPALEMLALSVFADNAAALSLYRSCGFASAGAVPRLIKMAPGRYKDDLTMWRDVRGAGQVS